MYRIKSCCNLLSDVERIMQDALKYENFYNSLGHNNIGHGGDLSGVLWWGFQLVRIAVGKIEKNEKQVSHQKHL